MTELTIFIRFWHEFSQSGRREIVDDGKDVEDGDDRSHEQQAEPKHPQARAHFRRRERSGNLGVAAGKVVVFREGGGDVHAQSPIGVHDQGKVVCGEHRNARDVVQRCALAAAHGAQLHDSRHAVGLNPELARSNLWRVGAGQATLSTAKNNAGT